MESESEDEADEGGAEMKVGKRPEMFESESESELVSGAGAAVKSFLFFGGRPGPRLGGIFLRTTGRPELSCAAAFAAASRAITTDLGGRPRFRAGGGGTRTGGVSGSDVREEVPSGWVEVLAGGLRFGGRDERMSLILGGCVGGGGIGGSGGIALALLEQVHSLSQTGQMLSSSASMSSKLLASSACGWAGGNCDVRLTTV